MIREKARSLYHQFSVDGYVEEEEAAEDQVIGPPKSFHGSKGWFCCFEKRFGLMSAILHGKEASADMEEAAKYPGKWKKIIKEKGYHPGKVFSMDEIGLYWKKMSSRNYVMKEELGASSFKAQKNRLTLFTCSNVAGYMLKPGLINKSANPRALKNSNKTALPLYWMHNKKAWVTKPLMSTWFRQSSIPQVKKHLNDLCMEFKVLLILGNAGRESC